MFLNVLKTYIGGKAKIYRISSRKVLHDHAQVSMNKASGYQK